MSPESMSFESNEGLREKLLRFLKERGFEDAETKVLLLEWENGENKKVENQEGSWESLIAKETARGELYLDSGFKDLVIEEFEVARMIAYQSYNDDIVAQIDAKIQSIKPSI